jgi:hypothetical protein
MERRGRADRVARPKAEAETERREQPRRHDQGAGEFDEESLEWVMRECPL